MGSVCFLSGLCLRSAGFQLEFPVGVLSIVHLKHSERPPGRWVKTNFSSFLYVWKAIGCQLSFARTAYRPDEFLLGWILTAVVEHDGTSLVFMWIFS